MNNNTRISFIKEDPWRIFRIMAEFVDSFEALSQVGPGVTVFGSARFFLALFRWAWVIHGRYRLFDIGGAIGLAGMAAMLIFFSLKNATRLYREERIS